MQSKGKLICALGPLLSIFCIAMIFSLFNTILPVLKGGFHASLSELQWVMNVMGIFLCSTLVIMGRMSDRYGRKRLSVIAAIVTILAFSGIGLAPSIQFIILCQAFVGLGAAVFLLASQSVMLQYYTGLDTSKGMAIWAGVVAIGLALGPLVGGLSSLLIGWRALFFILAGLMLIGMVLTVINTADPVRGEQKQSLNGWGALLLGITIAAFVFDVVESHFLPLWLLIAVAGIFVVALCILIWHENHADNPIILFHLLRNQRFFKGSTANGLTIFYVWGAFFVMPYYLQTTLHVNEFHAGLMMLFVSIPLAAMSFVIGKLYLRFSAKSLLSVGFSCMMLAALIQTQMLPSYPLYLFVISCLLFGFGWGFTWSVSMTAAMSDLPAGNEATATGTFLTFQELGGSVGLAAVVAIARIYPDFIHGYQAGMWVLVAAAAIALIISLSLRHLKKQAKQ